MSALGDLLLISRNQNATQQLSGALAGSISGDIVCCSTKDEAFKIISQREFGAILISPQADSKDLLSFAKALSVKCASGILVILPQGDKSALEYEESGIFVINRPISKQLMINSVKMSMIAKKRLEIMMDEQTKLKDKIEENRLIDRAKCVLIQYLRLSEPQAHRYIEKQAMDMRTSKMEVALGILKTYDS